MSDHFHTPAELKDNYPYMFTGPDIGISFSKGWLQIFAQLCKDIDELLGQQKRGFHWTQVKEKFGTSRFYWDLGRSKGSTRIDIQVGGRLLSFQNAPAAVKRGDANAQLMVQIASLVSEAERATGRHCVVCGAQGTLDDTGGYLLTLCHAHAEQRNPDGSMMESPWYGQDDTAR